MKNSQHFISSIGSQREHTIGNKTNTFFYFCIVSIFNLLVYLYIYFKIYIYFINYI